MLWYSLEYKKLLNEEYQYEERVTYFALYKSEDRMGFFQQKTVRSTTGTRREKHYMKKSELNFK